MSKIRVKTAEGRVALSAPKGGIIIPSDKFIEVADSHWIRRRIKDGDLIEEKTGQAAPAAPPAAPKTE